MSTNVQIIGDALGLLNVLAEGESVTAEQGAHALRVLNQMLAAWAADDIVLGYFEQTETTDPCPIPDWAEQGVSGKLALVLAGHYRTPPSPFCIAVADEGYSLILRTLMNQRQVGADLSHLGSGNGRYDILTDA